MEQLLKGGLMMIPLALCSVVAAVVAFERMFALRRGKVIPPRIAEVADKLAAVETKIGLQFAAGGVAGDDMRFVHKPDEILALVKS